jgi:hypothetical protein
LVQNGYEIINKKEIIVAGSNSLEYELKDKSTKTVRKIIYVPYIDSQFVFKISIVDNIADNQTKEKLEKVLSSLSFD